MRSRSVTAAAILAGLALTLPSSSQAQILDRVKKAAERAVVREAENQTERLIRNAIRCLVDDPVCAEKAEGDGEKVIYVDDEGEVITDEEGVPITDRQEAMATAPPPAAPGEGVWANYDFVPGEEILFYDDYSGDRVGDFPRRMNFVRGNWEVVEWEGRRLLRNLGRRHAAVEIPLPRKLPDRFTVELETYMPHPNHQLAVVGYSPASDGGNWTRIDGQFVQVGTMQGTGVTTPGRGGLESVTPTRELEEKLVPIRIMVDGRYAKVYVGSKRVANVPSAELRRSSTLYLENMYMNNDQNPIYIGPIRVAAGGRDLYDDLLDDSRAVTRGILFAVNSDRIRPESTPTLEEIGTMLTEHPELRLRIEGHTDSDGEEAHNQDLSERRGAAVKRYLVERHGVEADRLETEGYGESQPVADNDTPEGKQENRRVELVRLEG